jgi:hypothetical protein
MNDKLKNILSTSFIVIVNLVIALGAIAKIAGLKSATEALARNGVGNYVRALGIMEIIFVALFLYKKTFRLGFYLLCCYFGGAIATHLSHGENFMQPAVPLILIWITTFLRDRTIFLGKQPDYTVRHQ